MGRCSYMSNVYVGGSDCNYDDICYNALLFCKQFHDDFPSHFLPDGS